jgi:hypothetical protein
MSLDANAKRPLLTPPARGAGATPTLRPGSVTLDFFREGDEQEASGYENVVLDEETAPSADLEFDSFDKVPRKRRPLIAVAVAFSCVALGAVVWKTTHAFSKEGARVRAASRAMVTAQPATAPTPVVSAPTTVAPIAAPAAPVAPTSEPPATAALTIDRSADDEPAARAQPVANPAVGGEPDREPPAPAVASDVPEAKAKAEAPVPVKAPAQASHRQRRPVPLHGYVWSPEAHTLVPATPAMAEPAPTVIELTPERRVDPVPERDVVAPPDRSTTTHPRFDPPAPTPTGAAPIIE